MVLKVLISPEAEAKLRDRAAAAGVDVETYAARWLEMFATPPLSNEGSNGHEASDPAEDEMTEEELSEFIEAAIHAMRAEKRAREQK